MRYQYGDRVRVGQAQGRVIDYRRAGEDEIAYKVLIDGEAQWYRDEALDPVEGKVKRVSLVCRSDDDPPSDEELARERGESI